MAYTKEKYEAQGSQVTYHFHGSDEHINSHSAWINGNSISLRVCLLNADEFPEFYNLVEDSETVTEKEVRQILAYLVDKQLLTCSRCDSLYPEANMNRKSFAGHICGECKAAEDSCPGGDDHDWKCTNPHQRTNARVATKFSCQNEGCSQTKSTTPTG